MNQHELIVIGLLLSPVLLLMLLRVNAAIVFLSLCLGYVVMQFLASDVQAFAGTFMSNMVVSTSAMKLGLVLAPAALTTLFMVGTAKGVRLLLNILPALAVGYLVVLFVIPLLPPGTAHAMMDLSLWHQAVRLQSLLVGGGALISLFFLWMQRSRRRVEEHTSKRH